MQVQGYEGICAACFEPIREGQGYKFREKGRNFHKRCIESARDYYIRIEEIEARFETAKQEELPGLMTELEHRYHIPLINNESFNEDNKEVMDLYRRISNSRDI